MQSGRTVSCLRRGHGWAMDVIMPRRMVEDGSRSHHGRSSELLKPSIIGSVRSVQKEPQISDVIGKGHKQEYIRPWEVEEKMHGV